MTRDQLHLEIRLKADPIVERVDKARTDYEEGNIEFDDLCFEHSEASKDIADLVLEYYDKGKDSL